MTLSELFGDCSKNLSHTLFLSFYEISTTKLAKQFNRKRFYMTYHFVYKTTNLINKKFYIGKHSTSNLDDGYLGSGLILRSAILKYGKENFSREVLKFFDSSEEALTYEKILVTEEFCSRSNTYNLTPGGSGNWYGTVSVKDKEGNTYVVSKSDPRYLSGELISNQCGRVQVKDVNGNIFQVDITDHRFKSGELVGTLKGFVTVKNKNGKTYSVKIDDPRYLSGEFQHIFRGTVSVKDKDGNMFHVAKNDPRLKTGELVGIRKGGKPTTQDRIAINNGERVRFISKDEELPEGWIKGSLKGKRDYSSEERPRRKCINNGEQNRFILLDEKVPEGWKLGNWKNNERKINAKRKNQL